MIIPYNISCIIPVHNGARFLAEAIESIVAQSYPAGEIIVVDDGSEDESCDIARRYPGVRVIMQKQRGPAAARNLGVDSANGEWLAFLDSDDLWEKNRLEKAVKEAEANGGSGLFLCSIQNFWEKEVEEEGRRLKDHKLTRPAVAYTAAALFVRKETFRRIGKFNEELKAGDAIDWFLRAQDLKFPVHPSSDVLVRRRLHLNNRSRFLTEDSRRAVLHAIKESLSRSRN